MHDLALRAQVLQGYEEFKVRLSFCPPFIHASGANHDLLLSSYSLLMGLSRLSLVHWDSRRWNYN